MTFVFPDAENFGHVQVLRGGEDGPTRFVFSSLIASDIMAAFSNHLVGEGPEVEVCPINQFDWSSNESVRLSYHRIEQECIDTGWYSPGWHKLDRTELLLLGLEEHLGRQAGMDDEQYIDVTSKAERFCHRSLLVQGTALRLLYVKAVPNVFNALLRRIWDIRRFVDPMNPTRGGRLKSWLRLSSPRLFLKLARKGPPRPSQTRGRASDLEPWLMALSSWSLPVSFGVLGPLAVFMNNRKTYYHKLYREKGEDSTSCGALSLWRTTVDFVNLLRLLWLDLIGLIPFDPPTFFGDFSEILYG